MKKLIIPGIFLISAFASCQSSNSLNIEGAWQATAFETPTEDSLTTVESEAMLKEISAWTKIPDDVKAQFKVDNLDSAKKLASDIIKEQVAGRQPEREKLINSFVITFGKNGTVYRKTESMTDTSMWYAAKDPHGKQLILIDPFIPGKANIAPQAAVTVFEVEHHSGDSLRIKIRQPEEFKTFISFKKSK